MELVKMIKEHDDKIMELRERMLKQGFKKEFVIKFFPKYWDE